MKKITAILCAVAMLLSLASCARQAGSGSEPDAEPAADYSGQTLTGQVTEIDGTKVTLQLGELAQPDPMTQGQPSEAMGQPGGNGGQQENGQNPPEMPGGGQQGDGQNPPEMPDGGQQDGGQQGGGQNPPDMPGGGQQGGGEPQGGGQTPPDMSGGGQQGDGQNPPEMPGGGEPQGGGQTPSDVPEQGALMGRPEEPAGGFTANGGTVTLEFADAVIKMESGMGAVDCTIEDISVGSVLIVEIGAQNTVKTATLAFTGGMGMAGGMPDGMPGGFGGSGAVEQGSSAHTISEDGAYTQQIYASTGGDENALRIDGAAVDLSDITVEKSAGASSNTEDGDFYGMNAALLATNGATVTLQNSTITSSAQNGNGVFSYGSGTTVDLSDCQITTTADNSGGIQTTGGGTTNARNLTVSTAGNSSAAIRSDRGGGTVNVDGGVYTTEGYNSPAVYSTAAISVKNAALTARNSEALVIEGKNSIALENCTVTGNMSDTMGASSDENVHNVMIYQSMSGDADVGVSEFAMTGGTLTAQNGDMIYITNTSCTIRLSGVELVQQGGGYLLNVSGNSASRGWGAAGKNGGQVEFTAENQVLNGDIVVDSISTLALALSDGSHFTGTIRILENAQGGDAVAENVSVVIEPGSTWTLTGDCTLTSLENRGTIDFNGYTITLPDGTVLQ